MRIRKIFLQLLGLLWAATARGAADVGICYTRNNARDANRRTVKDNLRKVLVAAQSVRRHDSSLPLCLFTDLDARRIVCRGRVYSDTSCPTASLRSCLAPVAYERERLCQGIR